jgi:DNA invertase Pin-like site-specific DNA recombinase
MNDLVKVKPSHTQRAAFVYIRQSSPTQVEYNRESTARQYALVEKARELGWAKEQVIVIDEDLGVSGSGFAERPGFARLTAEVALAHVGIVFGLEVLRMARNNADWYRLFDLCSITDTLVGDNDGLYHPALFNDRLVLGLKGIMAEAELHILRARLEGGIRNKAARSVVEASPKSPAPRSENKRRNAAPFLSGGQARVPSRRDLTVWPIMPGAGFLALRVLADVAEESGNRVRA